MPKKTPEQNSAAQTRNEAQTAERDAEVWKLRIQGLTLREIGNRMDLHHTTVLDILNRGVKEVRDPLVGEVRRLADERWHLLWNKLQPAVEAGDVAAIEVGRKLLESWRKMYAVDGPVTINVNDMSQTDLALQELINEAEAALAVREAQINGADGD